MKRSFLITGAFLLVWLIVAQGCMKFRISDAAAKENFKKEGVSLTTATVKVNHANLHYAKTGNDTLPTIIFVKSLRVLITAIVPRSFLLIETVTPLSAKQKAY